MNDTFIKKVLSAFDKTFFSPFWSPRRKKKVWDFLTQKLTEAHENGEISGLKKGMVAGIFEGKHKSFDLLIESMPKDAENLSTLTGWQAQETIKNFLKKDEENL